MNKKYNKQKKLAILLALLLVLFSLGTILIRGTWSFYKKTVSGSSTATVAKFDAEINDKSINAENNTVTLNVFNTIKDTTDGNNETDVANGKIAPGTMGSFTIKVKNTGDTTIDVKASLAVTNNTNNVPLEFKTNEDGSDWIPYASFATAATPLSVVTGLDVGSSQNTYTVYWRWAFNDASTNHYDNDTAIGTADTIASPLATFTFDVTQVD
jgi:hypothetical protein